ncbi:MAG TPA: hypothetical protein VIF15_12830 [Polyangiaceae bacterium]
MQAPGPRVAVVLDGGGEPGRAIAIALAARGVRVVVVGGAERALGETVGEIAHAGGQARHVVGDAAAGLARAVDIWGRVDVVVAGDVAPRAFPAGAEAEDLAARIAAALAA